MDKDEQDRLSKVMQVFISSKTSEMKAYREKAIAAIQAAGMIHKNYNDPQGAGFTQSSKTIFTLNRDTVQQSDVFVGLYGFSDVWRPASQIDLQVSHPELLEDPQKLIMEYEYEWAQAAGLYMFLFLRTYDTFEVPPAVIDHRMDQFRLKLRSRTVGWLTTPDAFHNQLLNGLRGIEPRIFLSYSRKDTTYVSNLQQRLRNDDLHAWRDATNIPGSADWERELEAALDLMKVLLVIITPDSAKSEWVRKECEFFMQKNKPIVPYIANADGKHVFPAYLSKLQYIDGTEQNAYTNLIKLLRVKLDTYKTPHK